MSDLKYRERLSSSIDKGIAKAIHNYSIESRIPLSRLLDEAIEDFLIKNNIEFTKEEQHKKLKG